MGVPKIIKSMIPLPVRWALRRFALRVQIRGKAFPFNVSSPATESALNCLVAYNKYGAYCVPRSGSRSFSALHVMAGKVWEEATMDYIAAHSAGGDIVHAGAYFGDFLPRLASAADPGAKVWAFEPHPESYRCACLTILLNRLSNVKLANSGLGAKAGIQPLVTHDSRGRALGGMSSMSKEKQSSLPARDEFAISSRIVTLDEVVSQERKVSIIHLDVEGFEENALTGALGTIRRCKPILLVETVPGTDWFAQHLSPLGYRVAERVRDNTVLRAD